MRWRQRRAPRGVVMAAMIAARVACLATAVCVAEKSPLTNRIRRHFARIKAVRTDRGRSWLLPYIKDQVPSGDAQETANAAQDTSKATVRTRRRRRSGHVEGDGQD